MRDFTLQIFKSLCLEFQRRGYVFITFAEYCSKKTDRKFVILRHDVDRNPNSASEIALLEQSIGIHASYYFRIVKESYDESIINAIAEIGHEIGYHYEDLAVAKGNTEKAIVVFENNLAKLRQLFPIKTICMHGSPLSGWDNKLLWQNYDYRDFGIIGEPFFDVDFNKVLYLTDTGRCWDGADFSIRDKVESRYNCGLKSTNDIIKALDINELPDRLMLNVHPHRWNDKLLPWLKELIMQNTKNVGKRILVKRKQRVNDSITQ